MLHITEHAFVGLHCNRLTHPCQPSIMHAQRTHSGSKAEPFRKEFVSVGVLFRNGDRLPRIFWLNCRDNFRSAYPKYMFRDVKRCQEIIPLTIE